MYLIVSNPLLIFSLKDDKRKLAVLLDFDGTLAPITQHPKDTIITDEGDTYLRKLTARPDIFTAIISGRGLPDLKDKVSEIQLNGYVIS